MDDDIFKRKDSSKERSQIMTAIKSSGNKSTELRFIALLKASRIIGWRRCWPILGKPDFVFSKRKIAVFIDGCFWHGCPRHCRMPSSNCEYWKKKISGNSSRDRQVTSELKARGWIVYRIWEHELSGCASLTRKLNKLRFELSSDYATLRHSR